MIFDSTDRGCSGHPEKRPQSRFTQSLPLEPGGKARVPVLARMTAKRRVGYQAIGYKVLGTRDLFSDRVVTPSEPA
jgi:hypothetical protein